MEEKIEGTTMRAEIFSFDSRFVYIFLHENDVITDAVAANHTKVIFVVFLLVGQVSQY